MLLRSGWVLAVSSLAVLFLIHRYAWVRLVRDTGLRRPWRALLAVAFAVLFVALPAAFALTRSLPPDGRFGLMATAYVWLGLLFYVVLMFAALDVVRLPLWLARRLRPRVAPEAGRVQLPGAGGGPSPGKPPPEVPSQPEKPGPQPPPEPRPSPPPRPPTPPRPDSPSTPGMPVEPGPSQPEPGPAPTMSRRELLARASAGAVVLTAGSTVALGWRSAGEITLPEVPVRLPRLPRALDGLRIVQLSDLHLGMLADGRFLRDVVQKSNALRPDLVVITGDLVDGGVDVLGPEVEPLTGLRSRWGTLFVTGNHEYYSGADDWVAWLRARGIRVLMNERVALGADGLSVEPARGPGLDLAGVTDFRAGHNHDGHAPDLPRALAGRDPDRELVLLAHQPRQVDEAAAAGVGLQLSGHTHGGQLWPFGGLVGLFQPYIQGLHRHGATTQIYVSRGTGCWGPPMRVGAPAEIASVILHT
jgi:hypothetical protein